jgi:small subunit ribosomal protein S11e
MHRTLVIRREYLHYVPKYNRYERRHKNLSAHVSPAFRVEEGDMVTVGQCRPLSKTVRLSVVLVNFLPCSQSANPRTIVLLRHLEFDTPYCVATSLITDSKFL